MVEYERKNNNNNRMTNIGIEDLPDIGTLRSNIATVFNRCKSQTDSDVVLDDIIMFGSYARGVASKGESDLDLMVIVKDKGDGSSEKDVSLDSAQINICMDNMGDNIILGYEDWFNGVDIINVRTKFKWDNLARMSSSKQGDGRGGEIKVYSMEEQRFIDADEISKKTDIPVR